MGIETAVFFGLLLVIIGIGLVYGNPFKGLDLTTKDETKLDQDTQILEVADPVASVVKTKRVYKKKPKLEAVAVEKAPIKSRTSKKQQ